MWCDVLGAWREGCDVVRWLGGVERERCDVLRVCFCRCPSQHASSTASNTQLCMLRRPTDAAAGDCAQQKGSSWPNSAARLV